MILRLPSAATGDGDVPGSHCLGTLAGPFALEKIDVMSSHSLGNGWQTGCNEKTGHVFETHERAMLNFAQCIQ